jgi:DNA-binding MarR family transcriptional regulator
VTVPEEITRIEEQLRRITLRFRRDLGSVSANLLPAAQLDVLRCLHQRGNLTVSQLAKELSVTASAITSLSDRLVKSNLVQRMADKSDRRLVRLGLTPEGKELFEKIHAETLERVRSYFQRVPKSEMRSFVDTLSRLVSLMEEGSGQGEAPSRVRPNGLQ